MCTRRTILKKGDKHQKEYLLGKNSCMKYEVEVRVEV